MERRVALRQLVGKAAEGPNVDLFVVLARRGNLWRDPRGSAALCRTPRLLLSQEDAEAEVCNFYISIRTAEDIVRLDVSMQNVVLVHLVESHRRHVQRVLHEWLRKVTFLFNDDLGQVTTLHKFEEDPQTVLILEDFLTPD